MTQLAREAPAFSVLIDPDDTVFLPAGDMPKRIVDYCQQTGQTPPSTPGAIVRCALESLAFKYRWTLEQIETVCNRQIDTVHIVGGGTQNRLLCQFTADATGRQVIAGPVEATAIGNIAIQAIAAKEIGSLTEARQIIKKTFQMQIYEPTETEQWDQVYQRFLEITGIREGVL